MKIKLIFVAVAVFFGTMLLWFASKTHSQAAPHCAGAAEIEASLKETYGEKLMWSGATPNGNTMIMYGVPGKTWTIGIKNAAGSLICIVMTGKGLKDERQEL